MLKISPSKFSPFQRHTSHYRSHWRFEYYGLQSYPLTYKLIDDIDGNASLFVVIILVFFSGELIWRDRNSKINEVIDSTPHISLISLSAKTLSLISLTVLLQIFFIFCGIVYQLVNGYFRIELEIYLLDFFYANFLTYVIWSGVMITIQHWLIINIWAICFCCRHLHLALF